MMRKEILTQVGFTEKKLVRRSFMRFLVLIKLEEIIPTRKNLEFDDSDILKYAEPEYQVHYHSEETTKFNKRQNMLQITDFKKFTPLTVREDVTDATDVYEEGHPYGCLYYDHHSGEVYVSIFGTPKPFQSKVRKVARSKKSLVRNDELKKTIRTMLAKYANLTQTTITIYKLPKLILPSKPVITTKL